MTTTTSNAAVPLTSSIEAKRPGGLTALAILNFVFALVSAWGALVVWDLSTGNWFSENATRAPLSESATEEILLMLAASSIAVLLVVSGVGYLKRLRLFGRIAGNVFSFVALATAAAVLMLGPGGLGAVAMLCAIYPVITLVMINGQYKAHLTR